VAFRLLILHGVPEVTGVKNFRFSEQGDLHVQKNAIFVGCLCPAYISNGTISGNNSHFRD